jgi:glycosyltransferase involved in cell wall biosynthesis
MSAPERVHGLSVVLPAYNEEDNVVPVVEQALECLERVAEDWEVIVVDDGSTDGTATVLSDLVATHPEVRGIRFRRNLGKSAALQVGFTRAEGEVLVCMDADGQDDPAEVRNLLARLDEGADLVTGRRAVRHDRLVKRVSSRTYNTVTRAVTGVPGSDLNSGLKVMRADVANSIELYGELHRYIPVMAHWAGYRTDEVAVQHHPRRHGTSKFGRARFWRGFLDLVTVKFLTTWTLRPFHLFGGIGVVFALLGGGILGYVTVLKLAGEPVGQRPALAIGVLFVVVAVQMVSLGLLSELIVHLRRSRGPESFTEDV